MRRRTFTLVEVIVAMGIMLLVAGIVAGASFAFFRAWKSSQTQTERLRELMNIDLVMDGCVRNMIPFHWIDPDENDDTNLVFDGQENMLFFASVRRTYGSESGALMFVRIRVDEFEGALVADYSMHPRLPWLEDDETSMPWKTEILARGVRNVTFLYAADQAGAVVWLDEWDRETYDFLPLAVQMTVEWEDGRSEVWLRRSAGVSSNTAFGSRREVTGE